MLLTANDQLIHFTKASLFIKFAKKINIYDKKQRNKVKSR